MRPKREPPSRPAAQIRPPPYFPRRSGRRPAIDHELTGKYRQPMVQHLAFVGYLLAGAYAMAKLEVQIEGAQGWARGLPTWRINNLFTRIFFGHRPLTGYHFFLHILIALLVHAPFGLGFLPFSLPAELRIISFIILFWLIEDWLWFVVNPAFGPAAFRAERISWHRRSWWWIMPREYWFAGPIGAGLYVASHLLT
jgi:hypothetical protein